MACCNNAYDPCQDTLFGRPITDWRKLDIAIRESGVGVDAFIKLAAKPDTLAVYDIANPKRLLGTLDVRGINLGDHDTFRLAGYARLEPYYATGWGSLGEPSYTVVTFTIRRVPKGFDTTTQLHTETPLERLMQLRNFYLPGETKRQQEQRFYA